MGLFGKKTSEPIRGSDVKVGDSIRYYSGERVKVKEVKTPVRGERQVKLSNGAVVHIRDDNYVTRDL